LVDANNYLLDVALPQPYGAWLDISDEDGFDMLCRDTLAEIYESYNRRQSTLPLGDRRPAESSTLSVSLHHFN
jgi:hypothetical protein